MSERAVVRPSPWPGQRADVIRLAAATAATSFAFFLGHLVFWVNLGLTAHAVQRRLWPLAAAYALLTVLAAAAAVGVYVLLDVDTRQFSE